MRVGLETAQSRSQPAALDRRLLEHRQRDELGLAAQVDAKVATRVAARRVKNRPQVIANCRVDSHVVTVARPVAAILF